MYRLTYPLLLGASYLGTRFVGLEKTVRLFERAGNAGRKLGLGGKKSADQLERELSRSYAHLPLSVRCLDQAVVTWSLLNWHGHSAELKIGVCLFPFQSHAWVAMGERTFVDFVYIPDMQIVAEYRGWSAQ